MHTSSDIRVPNETFMSLALQADGHKELSCFGKAVTVILVFLATAMEQGATEAEITLLTDQLKTAVLETAARVVAETAPALRS